jgi:hypothetical protein
MVANDRLVVRHRSGQSQRSLSWRPHFEVARKINMCNLNEPSTISFVPRLGTIFFGYMIPGAC